MVGAGFAGPFAAPHRSRDRLRPVAVPRLRIRDSGISGSWHARRWQHQSGSMMRGPAQMPRRARCVIRC